MTEEQYDTLPNGARRYKNEIAEVNVSIVGQELTFKKAAQQLRVIADMVEAKMMSADGFNWGYGGEYELTIDLPSAFPHGDYQDSEGNLVHVGQADHVINVTWANKNAEQEDVSEQDIHVFEWIKDHGPLKPAGSGEAEGHDGEPHKH